MKLQKFRRLATAALLAFASTAYAQAPAAPGKKAQGAAKTPNKGKELVPQLALQSWQLANGLKVLLLPNSKAPLITVQVWYHVGSKDEPRGMRGIAHMFEHLMFKGSKRVPPEEYARMIDKIGGDSNAFTTEDVTAFYQTIPKGYLDFVLELESERMRNLLLTPGTVNSEREVVKEEKRQRLDNDPLSRAFERFRQIAFTRHPYGWTPAGDLTELDQVTVEACQRFYDTYYQPNNATLVIVGDTDEATVKPLIEKRFGVIAKGKEPPRPAAITPEPEQTKPREEVVSWPSQVGAVIIGWHAPPAASPDSFALELLASILSSGESSRLTQVLTRGKNRVAVQAGGSLMTQEDPGLMVVYGLYPQGGDPAKVKAALLGEIKKVTAKKVTAQELNKAKNQMVASYVFGLQRVEGVATQLGSFHYLYGDANRFLTAAKDLDSLTVDDVLRVAKKYLLEDRLTVVHVKPKPPEKPAAKKQAPSIAPDKTAKPAPAPDSKTPAPAPAKPAPTKEGQP